MPQCYTTAAKGGQPETYFYSGNDYVIPSLSHLRAGAAYPALAVRQMCDAAPDAFSLRTKQLPPSFTLADLEAAL